MSENSPQPKPPELTLKHGAKAEVLKNELKEQILKEIKGKPNYQSLKLDVELTRAVCLLIEERINNNKKKRINKKELAISCLNDVFSLSVEERNAISKQIDSLHSRGKLKKKWFRKLVFGTISLIGRFL